ncbi:ABC transporter permease [Fulvivirgaceae bacterium BMA12]|uniref:ABC transporter permease n=1 Tax=Agaribacillus aureus TaxID=3051825 RepID=A0ABT8LBQ5_9BACT|nr:ABC transporter permease [Fulvivirgaceae bacterium BMA12]
MFKNYMTIVRRNLASQPVYTILNLTCLTAGIAAVLYILLYLNFELKYDRFHTKADRIFRVETTSIKTHEKVMDVEWRSTPANLGPFIMQDYSGIENYVRIFQFWQNESVKFHFASKSLEEEDVFAVDATVFQTFSFNLISGDPLTALDGPNKIVLSKGLAHRIFGDEDPVGKILTSSLVHTIPDTDRNYALTVTGVYRDNPKNTLLTAKAMISSETDPHLEAYYFNSFNVYTFLLLDHLTNPGTIASWLPEIYKKYLNAEREPVLISASHELVPLTKIHLNETGGPLYIYIFSVVSLLLLLIAGISYVNLVIARAKGRGVEIGIRKVMGSHRWQIAIQFLSESLLFTFASLVIAIGMVIVSIDFLNKMLGLQLEIWHLTQSPIPFGIIAIMLLLGILGGGYPAFFMSSFEPVGVMKGFLVKSTPVRTSLVTIQLIVVIFVVTCTGLIYGQLQYLRNKNLGFNKELVIMLTLPEQSEIKDWQVMKNALAQSPLVSSSGTSSFIPGAGNMRIGPVSAENSVEQEQRFAYIGRIDYDFLATMGIEIVSGRNFSPDFPGDASQAVIVNETFVNNFNMKDPLAKKIRFGGKGNPNFFQVVGIVKDFHQNSLYDSIQSQMFLFRPSNNLSVKISKNLQAAMDHIKRSWEQVFPNSAFTYKFLDDQLQSVYEADQVRGKVFFSLSLLTIVISFLGLFGLASYLATQRVREIGIRKILGAGLLDVILLMTRDFLLMVVIAAIPGFTIAWFTFSQWLEKFAFRIQIDYFLFGIVLLFTLLLTFVTTGLHAIRSARLNPADALRRN